MTPKEKAIELVDKYRTYVRIADKYDYNLSEDEIHISKQCALITVDEIIESDTQFCYGNYWQEVKQEIEKL
jgi:hypothetical protein